ncbi:hypothetical protein [Bradyrhizobium erythrophlei]|uniref:hypothetical protein n=1 Tax=Bradyrhizobium erythrophlei TaxID=1437360 RepID=UPI00115F854A|nr:hypothetical protein [Bradyrhizobium erythrophlei]
MFAFINIEFGGQRSSSTSLTAQPAQPERRKTYRQRFPNSLPTDVLEWLQINKPQSFDELMDLRRALYPPSRRGNARQRQAA